MSDNELLQYDWYNEMGIEREAIFIRGGAARLAEHVKRLPKISKETRDLIRALDEDLTALLIVTGIALGDRDNVALMQDRQERADLRLQAAE